MCGIFGVVGNPLPQSAIGNVLRVLEHRGPDGNGAFMDDSARVTLAHTRLAVIDLATGAQPIESADGNVVIVCNGEIYDFERIRSSLESKGYEFKTRSDSEVIIYLYAEHGLGCFEHLRGEFSFLLYDKARRRLHAARDRFGIKPLYFSRIPGGIVFGSEMKALFASGLVAPRLNVGGLDPLLDQDPVNVQFPFEGIEHVLPASCLSIDIDSGEVTSTLYWSREIPTESAKPLDEPFGDARAACADLVRRELEDAVSLRLRADVPVGLYLSGGIDSSFVGALMKRNSKTPLHSFSIDFADSDRSEREAARRTADFLGTQHHELSITREALWDHFEECLWFSEFPFFALAPVGKFLLSREARKYVTVVLTGEGADEVFLGYRNFFQQAICDTRLVESGIDPGRPGRATRPAFYQRLLEWLSLRVYRRKHRRALARARAHVPAAADGSKPVINAVQEQRIANMPLRILSFLGDRTEMANSLEARLPFLDHHLYDAAKWIPVDLKMRDGIEKAVVRDAAQGILPDEIRLRRKLGFMRTNAAEDFFRADRSSTRKLRRYLRKEAFDRAEVFSYASYWVLRLMLKTPFRDRFSFARQMHQFANCAILGIIQGHMLQRLFIDEPPWKQPAPAAEPSEARLVRLPASVGGLGPNGR